MANTASASKGTVTHLRVAVLQTAPRRGELDANLRQIKQLAASVANADLVVTCELSLSGFVFRPEQTPTPLGADDVRLRPLAEIGPALSVGIVERASGTLPHNSALLFGDRISVQRKLHLVSYAPWNERALFEPGTNLAHNRVRGVRVATLICNDAWHPVMPWLAAHAGAEVLLIPAASVGSPDEASARSWDIILRHTARILQCFVVFANRIGAQDGKPFWGGSRILDPTGEVIAHAGSGREVIEAELDLTELRRIRGNAPLLGEVRPLLIENLLSELEEGGHRV